METQQGPLIAYDENVERRLKHLDFVEATMENMVVFLRRVYELTKEHCGPDFTARVEAFKGFVTTIFGPVCEKFHHVPFQLLEFLDHKVDELIREIDWKHQPLPELLSQVAKKATEVGRQLAIEIQATGLLDATTSATKEAYLKYKPVAEDMVIKYEPLAEEYAVRAWQLCKQVPVLYQATQLMVPAAAFWAERYNLVVVESGLPVAQYLPLIPVERIARVFAEETDKYVYGNVSDDRMEHGLLIRAVKRKSFCLFFPPFWKDCSTKDVFVL